MQSLPLPRRIWYPWQHDVNTLAAAVSFNVDSIPRRATLALSCSGDYRVFLNGHELAPDDEPVPSWWIMHHLDATAFVQTGDNQLLIAVRHTAQQYPFLLAALDDETRETPVRLAQTDKQWNLAHKLEGDNLPATSCPDPTWTFDGVYAEPYGLPGNCPDDFLRLTHGRQQIHTEPLQEVVDVCDGLGRWLTPPAEGPLAATPFPPASLIAPPRVSYQLDAQMAHLIAEHAFRQANEWLEQYEARCPRVVYRLERNTYGRIVLVNQGRHAATLALCLGESRGELDHYNRRFTEIFTLQPGERRATRLSGFQFAKVLVLAGIGEVQLAAPQVQHVRHPVGHPASFDCSCDKTSTIWSTSRHTIHLCMQNETWDGARRDYLPWMGDLHLENLCAYHALGDCQLARRSLQVLRELGPQPVPAMERRHYAGLSRAWRNDAAPEINGMPTYTAWWLVGALDYVLYSGDMEFLLTQADGILPLAEQLLRKLDADGFWPAADFVEWAEMDAVDTRWACHGLALRAIRDAAHLLELARQPAAAARLHDSATHMAEGYALQLQRAPLTTHHACTMAVYSEALDTETAAAIFRDYANHPSDAISTPWWRYYEMEAASRAGLRRYAFERLRAHWQPMLQAGATTFWEQFDERWLAADDPHAVAGTNNRFVGYGGYRISQCHGWSAGPAVWLHQRVLGVRPAPPPDGVGLRTVLWNPDLHGLQHAAGEIPTPLGSIRVDLRDGQATLALPAQLTAIHEPTGERITGTHTLPLDPLPL